MGEKKSFNNFDFKFFLKLQELSQFVVQCSHRFDFCSSSSSLNSPPLDHKFPYLVPVYQLFHSDHLCNLPKAFLASNVQIWIPPRTIFLASSHSQKSQLDLLELCIDFEFDNRWFGWNCLDLYSVKNWFFSNQNICLSNFQAKPWCTEFVFLPLRTKHPQKYWVPHRWLTAIQRREVKLSITFSQNMKIFKCVKIS